MKYVHKNKTYRPVGRGGFDGFDRPFDAANRLTTSIQSPYVAITARVEAISLSGPAFWLELKKTVCGALHGPLLQRRGKSKKHMLIQILCH